MWLVLLWAKGNDSRSIPIINDPLFVIYGENDLNITFSFYGQPVEDDYKRHKSYSSPL